LCADEQKLKISSCKGDDGLQIVSIQDAHSRSCSDSNHP